MGSVEEKRIRTMAQREFAGHAMSAGPVVTRRFRRTDGRSDNWFDVTWTPGSVVLSGDVGELSIVHHSALARYRDGMAWLARTGADHDYIMGKASPREREFDREGTVRLIMEMANEDLGGVLRARRDDLHRYLADRGTAVEAFGEAFDTWMEGRWAGAAQPKPADFLPRRADYVAELGFEMKPGYAGRSPSVFPDEIDERSVPEGYEVWFRLWRALRNSDYGPYEPETIFTAAGRREIAEEMESYLSDGGMERCAQFCCEAGLADFYGIEKYADRTVWQVEAIRHAAALMLAEAEREERRWTSVVRRRLGALRAALSLPALPKRRPA